MQDRLSPAIQTFSGLDWFLLCKIPHSRKRHCVAIKISDRAIKHYEKKDQPFFKGWSN
jgi:hypothetical protein